MLRKMGLVLFVLLMGRTASAASLPTESAFSERIDRVVAKAISENRIVGAVVIVSRDGKVLYEKASGLADRERNLPMQKDTVFRLASMTKPITSVAVLRLADQNLLKLDDPVTKWLPDFRPRTADGKVPIITIRHLLTHTSGLNYTFFEAKGGPYHKFGVSDGLDDSGISLDENLRRISRAPLLFAPGTSWHYSLATDVLGRVIEKVTNMDLDSVIRKLITGPLAMKDTEFVASHPERLATPYADGKPVPVRMPPLYRFPSGSSTINFSPSRAVNRNAYFSGGAGMVGTAADYLWFLEAVRTKDISVLKPESSKAVFESSTGRTSIQIEEPGWGWALMSAILIDPKAAQSPQNKGTIGWGGVYGHTWWVDPVAGLTVIILTNTAVEGMSGSFPSEVKRAIYDNL
jgi:CubicO group peptidase (beta-lactamase class C family)